MPSPVGHVLGGAAVGSLLRTGPGWRFPLLCGVAAAVPDIDFLLPLAHRGPTHSIGAALIAFALVFAVVHVARLDVPRTRVAGAIAIAVLTHVLFDWLGQDRSNPRGLMALWPWTSSYYVSDVNVFNGVDRRYWADGFWRRNAIAVTKEVAILLPILWLSRYKNRGRSSARGAPPRPSA